LDHALKQVYFRNCRFDFVSTYRENLLNFILENLLFKKCEGKPEMV